MTNINAFSSSATVEIKDGRNKSKFSLAQLVDAVAQKVLDQLQTSDAQRPELVIDDLGLELSSEMARNVAKATKLAGISKNSLDSVQANELIQEARLKVKLGKDIGDTATAERVYEDSKEIIADIQNAFEAYTGTEGVLNRSLVKKIWHRGKNDVDHEAHAGIYSDIIDSQIKLRTLFKDHDIAPELRNEILSQAPEGANQTFDDYRKSLN